MPRLLLLLAIVVLVFWLIRRYRRSLDDEGGKARPAAIEDMVRCAECGMHLPRSESVESGGRFYCSAEHRRSHQA